MEIRHLKLSTGEEIVCEILEWPDEDDVEMVVRNVVEITSATAMPAAAVAGEGYKYYSLKPWMTMQEGPSSFIIINTNHIVGEGKPAAKLLQYYNNMLERLKEENQDEERTAQQDAWDDWVNKLVNAVKEMRDDFGDDSSGQKVINFPGNRDKIH